jgi:hypothetical protein
MLGGKVSGHWDVAEKILSQSQLLDLERIFEIQKLAKKQAAVFEVGNVDDIEVEIYVCFESECQVGLLKVIGAGFVIRMEDGRYGLI